MPEQEARDPTGHGQVNPFPDAAALVSSIFGGGGAQVQGQGSAGPFFDMLFGGFPGGSRGQSEQQSGQGGGGNPNVRHTATGVTFTLNPNRGNNEPQDPMDQMFQSFLSNLVVSLGGQGQMVGGQGTNMIGNLGDYVWGSNGLDAIVTQLMNQMEGTGPPPLDTEKLERLRTVKIQPEQIAMKLQCSVCWDDFHLDEEVKQLDCDHVYHPACILPWLKLHGTCPICRRDFTEVKEGNEGSEGQNAGGQSATGTPTASQAPFPLNLLQRSGGPSASATSSSSAVPPRGPGSNESESSSNAPNRTRPPFDMDMEFD